MLPIKFYIHESDLQDLYNGKPVYSLNDLTCEMLDNFVIILCTKNQEVEYKKLAATHIISQEDIILAERLFSLLDDKFFNIKEERKIVVWSDFEEIGNIEDSLTSISNIETIFLSELDNLTEPYDQLAFVLGTHNYNEKKTFNYTKEEFPKEGVVDKNGKCIKELTEILQDPFLHGKITDIKYFLNRI